MTELPEFILSCPDKKTCLLSVNLLVDNSDNGMRVSIRKLMNGSFEIMLFGYIDVEVRNSLRNYGKLMEIEFLES